MLHRQNPLHRRNPAPVEPVAPATTPDLSGLAADVAVPVAATSALAAAGILKDAVSAESDNAVVASDEPVGFTLPVPATPAAAEPEANLPSTGFAAELMARIQAEDNNQQQNDNETVGSPNSETTHSPLAADGHSFSSPESDPTSISSLIPELPSTSALAPTQDDQHADQPESLETSAAGPVETTTTESAERQTQSSSVSALLERMKDEGQWGGLSEEEAEEATTPAPSETQEAPVLNEADEDVQSYMSQLLSRMRDPSDDSPRPAAASVATQQKAEPTPEVVEAPKPVGVLKPEEYIPKNKACRLDSLQDMRALANTQTRTAIDRSQAKRLEESIGIYNLMIGVGGCVAAAIVFMLGFVGYISTVLAGVAVVMIAVLCAACYFGKTLLSKLVENQQNNGPATPQQTAEATQATNEAV